jgi:cbb3-type cytochrome oxidase subunit 1
MIERFQYDNRIVKNFLFVTILWGLVGMLVGLTAAIQLVVALHGISRTGAASVVCVPCTPTR